MTPHASRALHAIRDAHHHGSWADFATALRALHESTPRVNWRLRTRIAEDLRVVEDQIMREIGVEVTR